MKITKDEKRVVVELSKDELKKHNLTYSLLDCRNVHTRDVLQKILLEATGEPCSKAKEIQLLPDSDEGCVIVLKEREKLSVSSVSFSVSEKKSEIFSCFFS